MCREYHAAWIETLAKECNSGWHIFVTQPDKACYYTILDKTNSEVYCGTFHECEQFFYGYKARKREEH